MSALDPVQASTDELLRDFADTAKRAGSVFGPRWDLLHPTPPPQHLVDRLRTISAELKKRRPVAKLRELLEDSDRDVRGWAAGQFLSVDPEWATASLEGLVHKLTTREVLAWRDRILKVAPGRPKVEEMPSEQLVARFVDAGERCFGATRFLSDKQGGGKSMGAYNRVADELHGLAKELHRRGSIDALVPLLEHPLITVRQKAAAYCLSVTPSKAEPILENIRASKSWPEFMFASQVLDTWDKGTYALFADDSSADG